MGPFDRFNDRAKRVLALAQDEAIRFNHNYIGTEHLLLGLVREGEGVAAHVLDSLGVELSKVRVQVEFLIGRGESGTTPSDISLHPRTKKIVELAIDEARKLGHQHVGTEHLLLGLIREGEGVASQVLPSLGVSLDKVRQQVLAVVGTPHVTPPQSARPAPEVKLVDAQGRKRDWYCEDVLSGKLRVTVLYEDERVLGFEHPYPQYEAHGVVVPKTHVASLLAEEALDGALLTSMLRGVQAIAKAMQLDTRGFRVEAKAATPGVTPHMHWHVIGPGLPPRPRPTGWSGTLISRSGAATTGPFDRFDDSGKTILALAQDEAIRLDHNYIGTEHLLAALVREQGGVGARALEASGVELSKVRTALEMVIGRGEAPTAPSDITLSPRTKKVIELAIDEARRLGHPHVGSGHILLGLVREGEGIASGILESLGVTGDAVRYQVIALMGKQEPPAPLAGV